MWLFQVEATAIPVAKDAVDLEDRPRHYYHDPRIRRLSGRHDNLLFGGHAAPVLDTPYGVTVKDNRDCCHAISMMKVSE